MNLLYINYWGFYDGLTQATSMPNINYISNKLGDKKLILVSIERNGFIKNTKSVLPNNVLHYKWYTSNSIFGKMYDFLVLPIFLLLLSLVYKIKFCQCRGATTGFYGYFLYKIKTIPFGVESFEPHLDYMVESGVWKSNSLNAKIQKWIEDKIKINASLLITVSENYKHLLEKDNPKHQIIEVQPCTVDFTKFDLELNNVIKIKIPKNHIIGIYVGKFGDIYYDLESFELFRKTFDFFKKAFFLIILSPDDKNIIFEKLKNQNIDTDNVFVDKVPHHQVPQFMRLADFAFSNIKPAPCRQFCSPIKNGEYWAMGLPILSPDGIGDDSDIIKKEQGGVIYTLEQFEEALEILQKEYLSKNPKEIKNKMRKIAIKYRSFEQTAKCLDSIFVK